MSEKFTYVVLMHKVRNIWEQIYGPESFDNCEKFIKRNGWDESSGNIMIHLFTPVKYRGKGFTIKGKIWERINM